MARKWKDLADFINHATEEEKREVYEVVMERAAARQERFQNIGGIMRDTHWNCRVEPVLTCPGTNMACARNCKAQCQMYEDASRN